MKKTKTTIHPFPGLRPFEEGEEHLFFGREKAAAELLSRLRTSRFLTIIGTSGSGKSSLIKAGFLPSLYRGFMAQAGSSWRVAFFRPGDNPIGNLADVLTKTGILSGDAISRRFIETTLRRSSQGLIEIVKQSRLPGHENLLIVVDQFEELFRFSKLKRSHLDGKEDSADFVSLLLECSEQTRVPIYVILAMRSDFLGDCTEFRGLPEAINNSQYLIPRMTREEIRAAVAGPIAVGGAEISPPLLSRVLNDVGDSPDQLPILQHALMRTWDYWAKNHEEGEPLSLKHYEAIGTMKRALSKHAEEAYDELKTERRWAICKKMFKLLTDRGEKDRGVRRPAKVSEICSVTNASEKEVINVINVFRQPGRTFLMPPIEKDLNPDSAVDISHESLMRIWKRLIRWVKEEEQSAELYLRLAQAAALHEEGKVGLWRDPELMLALKWREENKPTAVWAERYDPSYDRANSFLDAGKKQKDLEIKEKEREQKAKIKRTRIFAVIIGIAAVISIVLTFWVLQTKRDALHLKETTELQKKIAGEAKKRAAEERNQKEKAVIDAKKAEEAKEKAEKSEKVAIEAKTQAEKSENEAIEARAQAEENEVNAQIQELIADMNKADAEFGQYLAKAKKMAVHSIAKTEEKELKALLALTAFRMNSQAYINLDQGTQVIFDKFDKNTLNEFSRKKELDEAYKKLEEKHKELQKKSGKKLVPAEIFEALRKAYIANEVSKDILYPAESWALAVTRENNIVFNNWDGELFLSSLKPKSDDLKLPVIDKKDMINLSGNNMLRASSLAETKDRLFCSTREGDVIYWKKNKWKEKRPLAKHNARILSMAFSENKNGLFYSIKNEVYIHKLKDTAKVFFKFDNIIRALTVIEDAEHSFLIAADSKGNVFKYNLAEDIKEKEDENRINADFESTSGFHAIAYNRARKLLALANSEGELYLLSNIDCALLTKLESDTEIQYNKVDKEHKGIVKALSFSTDGTYLVSAGLDGTIMLWDLKGKKDEKIAMQSPILTIESRLKILSVVFDRKGDYIMFNDEQYLRICPTSPEIFYDKLCKRKKGELTDGEWKQYIGESIKKEDIIICPPVKEN